MNSGRQRKRGATRRLQGPGQLAGELDLIENPAFAEHAKTKGVLVGVGPAQHLVVPRSIGLGGEQLETPEAVHASGNGGRGEMIEDAVIG